VSVYSSANPVPCTIKIGSKDILPETTYARNISGENFIEFRFDQSNKMLYEISLIAVQNDTVFSIKSLPMLSSISKCFSCFISNTDTTLLSLPIKIYRSNNGVDINWNSNEEEIVYFNIGEGCALGVTSNEYLSSVLLTELKEDDIFEIFGF
jgi:hypothetical protein